MTAARRDMLSPREKQRWAGGPGGEGLPENLNTHPSETV